MPSQPPAQDCAVGGLGLEWSYAARPVISVIGQLACDSRFHRRADPWGRHLVGSCAHLCSPQGTHPVGTFADRTCDQFAPPDDRPEVIALARGRELERA
jgi:hypothetical protein